MLDYCRLSTALLLLLLLLPEFNLFVRFQGNLSNNEMKQAVANEGDTQSNRVFIHTFNRHNMI